MCESIVTDIDGIFSDPHQESIEINREKWEQIKDALQTDKLDLPEIYQDKEKITKTDVK